MLRLPFWDDDEFRISTIIHLSSLLPFHIAVLPSIWRYRRSLLPSPGLYRLQHSVAVSRSVLSLHSFTRESIAFTMARTSGLSLLLLILRGLQLLKASAVLLFVAWSTLTLLGHCF